jgi:hypothetical protein
MGSVSFGTVSGLVTDAKWFRTDPRCVQPAILSDEHPSAANLVRDSPGHRVGYFVASSKTALGPGALVYCDPPYLMSTRGGRRLYRHEMPDVHHRRLLRCCRRLKCMVMISGYWSRMYADALAGWSSVQFESMTRGGHTATEWLWFNFPAPVELHDYQYLGDNFRQRERIKRKKRRWTARLERMPALERQALFAAILETTPGKS